MEEKRLPNLLKSINMQEFKPAEVIVADNFSTDKTRELAKKLGAKVVDGGNIAVGRNNGAKVAKTDIFIFMDADVILPDPYTLVNMYIEFKRSGADVASTLLKLDENDRKKPMPTLAFSVYGLLKRFVKVTNKLIVESGCTMLSTREAFEKLNGFDENLDRAAEDLDYSRRAIKAGFKYKVLGVKIYASGRRYETVSKTVKSLIGALGAGIILTIGYKNKGKILDLIKRMYGELGGRNEENK